jgi:hypothetical protein
MVQYRPYGHGSQYRNQGNKMQRDEKDNTDQEKRLNDRL